MDGKINKLYLNNAFISSLCIMYCTYLCTSEFLNNYPCRFAHARHQAWNICKSNLNSFVGSSFLRHFETKQTNYSRQ